MFNCFSAPVKYITSIIFTVLLTAGTMYAIDITSTAQTATPGDKITSTWVNAVNTASVSAAGQYTISCSSVYAQNAGVTYTSCIRINTDTGISECKFSTFGGAWITCPTPW